jgi:hypothetical protein
MKKSTYLAGPMEAITEKEATNWRDRITPKLMELFPGIAIVDPCKTESSKLQGVIPDNELGVDDTKTLLKKWKKSGQWDKFDAAIKAIIKADLDAVQNSDFIIVFLDFKAGMGGTISELTIAHHHKIPIYAVCYDPISECNSWVIGMCRHGGKVLPNFSQALEAIEIDFKKKKE